MGPGITHEDMGTAERFLVKMVENIPSVPGSVPRFRPGSTTARNVKNRTLYKPNPKGAAPNFAQSTILVPTRPFTFFVVSDLFADREIRPNESHRILRINTPIAAIQQVGSRRSDR